MATREKWTCSPLPHSSHSPHSRIYFHPPNLNDDTISTPAKIWPAAMTKDLWRRQYVRFQFGFGVNPTQTNLWHSCFRFSNQHPHSHHLLSVGQFFYNFGCRRIVQSRDLVAFHYNLIQLRISRFHFLDDLPFISATIYYSYRMNQFPFLSFLFRVDIDQIPLKAEGRIIIRYWILIRPYSGRFQTQLLKPAITTSWRVL